MLCRRLGAAGLYGKPQERKGPGKRVRAGAGEGERLCWPEGALPAAPASGWARPGWRRPWRKLLFPFLHHPPPHPPPPTPRYWKDCVGETQKLTIIECGLGEGRTARAAQRKTKSASIRAVVTRGSSGRPLRTPAVLPVAHPQPSKISLGRSRTRRAQGEASGESVTIFFSMPCPRPHLQFSGFCCCCCWGRADPFCVKGLHLLSPAERGVNTQAGQDAGMNGGGGTYPRLVRAWTPAPTPGSRACRAPQSVGRAAAEMRGIWPPRLTTRTSPWGWSSGQNVFYNCKQ